MRGGVQVSRQPGGNARPPGGLGIDPLDLLGQPGALGIDESHRPIRDDPHDGKLRPLGRLSQSTVGAVPLERGGELLAGEATALRVGDVDFAHGVIRVSRSLSPGQHGELVEQSPKSHKARDVPLIAALRPYAEDAARGKKPDELLLAGPDGGRLTNHNVRRAVDWDTLRKAIGRPGLRMHDLRHTFATILFDAGASAPDVQATLGHSSLQVTERYSRARKGVALRAGAVLDQALGGDTGKSAGAKRKGASGRGNGPRMARTQQN